MRAEIDDGRPSTKCSTLPNVQLHNDAECFEGNWLPIMNFQEFRKDYIFIQFSETQYKWSGSVDNYA